MFSLNLGNLELRNSVVLLLGSSALFFLFSFVFISRNNDMIWSCEIISSLMDESKIVDY